MKPLIVANWKENFTVNEVRVWIDALNKELGSKRQGVEIVVCPSFILIPVLHPQLSTLNPELLLGAQDVSKFEEGQYTGEVSAKMLKSFVKYVIVGHSERRKYFNETDEDIKLKIEQCLKHGLTPIVCVSTIQELSSLSSEPSSGQLPIVAYEPLSAVGTGTPDTPENAQKFAEKIKTEVGKNVRVLYGGSVNSENVKSFVSQSDIDGVLVGQASLDAQEFARLCSSAIHCAPGAD